MSYLIDIAADHPCDRCGHASKFHALPERGSGCMMYVGEVWSVYFKHATIPGLRTQCWCDGFFPRR